ncbi:FAD-binding domain-containing protein [Thozetella sp. PMI_491]|nr:FAD-binding domain-containing protein [Thozetella sp. PMI_491]
MSFNFAELRSVVVEGDVLLPNDPGFSESLDRWSATNKKPAAAVVRPKTAAEVSAVVRFAVAHSLRFTVRGGGHNTSGESSAPSPDAFVLDLAHLNSVAVDPQAQTVTFGGGCIWAAVDQALWEHGLATVGGTVSHTGVGGLILGGGYGLLSGQYGMSVDVLVSCEVVLANGDIVTASEAENADLFWALRGAGTNFGVVTSFTMRGFPTKDVYSGLLMWPYSDELLENVLAFVNKSIELQDSKAYFMPLVTCDPATGTKMLGSPVFYDGTEEEGAAFYAPLLALPNCVLNTTASKPYPTANSQMDPMAVHGRRYMFGGAAVGRSVDVEAYRDAVAAFYEQVAAPGNEDLRACVLAVEVVPQDKIVEHGKEDKTAFSGREGVVNAALIMSWTLEDKDETVREIVEKTGGVLRAKLPSKPEGGAENYLNYLNPNIPADKALMRTGRLFGHKAPRLRELKAKYDPTNVFHKNIDLTPLAK